SGGGVPRERRVRDGEGGRGTRLARRGTNRGRDPARDQARRRRHHHHLLRVRRRAPEPRMRWRSPLVAITLAALVAVPPSAWSQPGDGGERDLGRRFILEARSQLPLADDPALNEYVEKLGKRLVQELGPQEFDYHFYVVESPTLNAFSVPGGYIFVFTGLIAHANSEDEL